MVQRTRVFIVHLLAALKCSVCWCITVILDNDEGQMANDAVLLSVELKVCEYEPGVYPSQYLMDAQYSRYS